MNNGYYPSGQIPIQGTVPPTSLSPNISNYYGPAPVGGQHIDYADSIFALNVGKKVTVYMSYTDSIEWRDRIFTGIIKDSGKDYLLIDDNGRWILLWLIYINYATFDQPVNH